MLLPAPGPGATPEQPAFLNLVNLFIGPPEFAVASMTPAKAKVSAGSNAVAAPAPQVLSKNAAKRTVQPQQIAGALLRTMLGNAQPVLAQSSVPQAVVPQASPALAIPPGPAPVVTAPPPPTPENSYPATQASPAAPLVPSNPQMPVTLMPDQTAPVAPPFELAFSLNLIPVNVPPAIARVPNNSCAPTVPARASDPTVILPIATPINVVTQTPAPVKLAFQGSAPAPVKREVNPDSSQPQSNRTPPNPKFDMPIQPRAVSQSSSPSHVPENVTDSKHEPPPSAPIVNRPQAESLPFNSVRLVAPVINIAPLTNVAPVTNRGTSQQNAPQPDANPQNITVQNAAPQNATPQDVQQPSVSDSKSVPVLPNSAVAKPKAPGEEQHPPKCPEVSGVAAKDISGAPSDPSSTPSKSVPDNTADVGRTVQTPAAPPTPQDTSRPLEITRPAAVDAIRNAEPVQPDAPVRVTGPVQAITVRISQPDTPAVDVHVLERGQQIQVDVRTPDPTAQSSLREELGTLVNSLQRAGYRAETFTPPQSVELKAASSEMSSQEDRDRGEANPGNSGGGGSSDRQPPHKQRDQRAQAWFEELEKQT